MSDNATLLCIVVTVLAACVILIVTGHGPAIIALAVLAVILRITWSIFP